MDMGWRSCLCTKYFTKCDACLLRISTQFIELLTACGLTPMFTLNVCSNGVPNARDLGIPCLFVLHWFSLQCCSYIFVSSLLSYLFHLYAFCQISTFVPASDYFGLFEGACSVFDWQQWAVNIATLHNLCLIVGFSGSPMQCVAGTSGLPPACHIFWIHDFQNNPMELA